MARPAPHVAHRRVSWALAAGALLGALLFAGAAFLVAVLWPDDSIITAMAMMFAAAGAGATCICLFALVAWRRRTPAAATLGRIVGIAGSALCGLALLCALPMAWWVAVVAAVDWRLGAIFAGPFLLAPALGLAVSLVVVSNAGPARPMFPEAKPAALLDGSVPRPGLPGDARGAYESRAGAAWPMRAPPPPGAWSPAASGPPAAGLGWTRVAAAPAQAQASAAPNHVAVPWQQAILAFAREPAPTEGPRGFVAMARLLQVGAWLAVAFAAWVALSLVASVAASPRLLAMMLGGLLFRLLTPLALAAWTSWTYARWIRRDPGAQAMVIGLAATCLALGGLGALSLLGSWAALASHGGAGPGSGWAIASAFVVPAAAALALAALGGWALRLRGRPDTVSAFGQA